jgi:TPR repeat protein
MFILSERELDEIQRTLTSKNPQAVLGAVNKLRKAVARGCEGAQLELGKCYGKGKGVEYNAEEAAKLYKLAADQGNAEAKFELGECFRYGRGVEKDATRAVRFYKSAANQGNEKALFELAECYNEGHGVNKDIREAARLHTFLADKGNARSQFRLGMYYENYAARQDRNIAKAARYYRLSADQGHQYARRAMRHYSEQQIIGFGLCYFQGNGVQRDEVEAASWFMYAANEGGSQARQHLKGCSARALMALGEKYQRGNGVEKNETTAAMLFVLAAEKKYPGARQKLETCSPQALTYLGTKYQHGWNGIEKNEKSAAMLYDLAASKGFDEAQFELGKCFEEGRGVKQNLRQAAQHYELAATQNNTEAQFALAKCYIHGRGVPRNEKTAINLLLSVGHHWKIKERPGEYLKACSTRSLVEMGQRYQYGNRTAKDEVKAARLYLLAAEKGHKQAEFLLETCSPEALIALGNQYEKDHSYGPDSDRINRENRTRAQNLYATAVNQGNKQANYHIGHLLENANDVANNKQRAMRHYHAAAAAGSVEAQLTLGVLYYYSNNKKAHKLAAGFLKQAADQGDTRAQFELGVCYEFGRGGAQKDNVSATWYYSLAAKNNPEAKSRLYNTCSAESLVTVGKHYQNVINDPETAVMLYRYGADKGDANAQYHLAKCYQTGQGVATDAVEAKRLCKLAADQGHQEAQRHMKSFLPEIKHHPKISQAAAQRHVQDAAAKPDAHEKRKRNENASSHYDSHTKRQATEEKPRRKGFLERMGIKRKAPAERQHLLGDRSQQHYSEQHHPKHRKGSYERS